MNFINKKEFLSIVSLSVFLVALITLVSVTKKNQNINSEAASPNIEFITDESAFSSGSYITEDFSSLTGSGVLTDQLLESIGISFTLDTLKGWLTHYASGFIGSASGPIALPGAPTGKTGIRLTVSKNTKMVGFYVQTGSPFNSQQLRPSASITLNAYDRKGSLLLSKTTDTCLGLADSCTPSFIGVSAKGRIISTIEIVANESTYTVDDLKLAN